MPWLRRMLCRPSAMPSLALLFSGGGTCTNSDSLHTTAGHSSPVHMGRNAQSKAGGPIVTGRMLQCT